MIPGTVRKIRLSHGWQRRLHRSRGAQEVEGEWTASGLALALGVGRGWVYRRLERGEIDARYYRRDPESGTYRIVKDPELIEHLRQLVPGEGEAGKSVRNRVGKGARNE